LQSLGSGHPDREAALSRLHEMLLRAARYEVGRRRGKLDQLSDEELDEIALQSADDALVALLSKLEQYRGASRFTT
jgi:RNA polymerase sigma-70 factor, ECF subfamily